MASKYHLDERLTSTANPDSGGEVAPPELDEKVASTDLEEPLLAVLEDNKAEPASLPTAREGDSGNLAEVDSHFFIH